MQPLGRGSEWTVALRTVAASGGRGRRVCIIVPRAQTVRKRLKEKLTSGATSGLYLPMRRLLFPLWVIYWQKEFVWYPQ